MMKIRTALCLLSFALIMACQHQPASKWPVVMPEDDGLSDSDKIYLLSQRDATHSSSGLAAVAQLYENQELYPNALVAINEAIMKDPMNSSYHTMKAKYAFELGNKSVAYRESLTAYQLGSKSLKQSLNLAQMAVALSEFKIVGGIIDSLLIIYPHNSDVLYLAARKYDREGQAMQAASNYAKVYKANPEDTENNYYYSLFLMNQGDYNGAKQVIALSNSLKENIQSCFLRADIYSSLMQYDSAAIWYQLAINKSADTATINKTLNSYQLAELTDSVISVSESAVLSFPDNKFYLYTAASNLDKRFRYEESLIYYQALYQLDTLDTLVAQELAYLQRKIAYLQRRKEEQKKLADSLNKVLPILTF